MVSRASFVQETTSTTGTGTYSLGGATTSRQSFIAGNGTGETVRYSVTDGADWEVCEGVITSGTPDNLTRGTVLESSNSGSAVNWGAGDKTVSQVFTPGEADWFLQTTGTGNKSVSGNPYIPEQTTLSGATITITVANGAEVKVPMSGNNALALASVPPSGTWVSIRIVQDATGSRVPSFSTDFDFGDAGTPVFSTAANAEDVAAFRSNGTKLQFMGIATGFA